MQKLQVLNICIFQNISHKRQMFQKFLRHILVKKSKKASKFCHLTNIFSLDYDISSTECFRTFLCKSIETIMEDNFSIKVNVADKFIASLLRYCHKCYVLVLLMYQDNFSP